jgi:predicted nucleotidyltransferase component of viral defense system
LISVAYEKQVRLLLRVLSLIDYTHPDGRPFFALKGGTAINFFVWDMPRLSVDIDLAYCPVCDRETALDEIHDGMHRLAETIRSRIGARGQFSTGATGAPKLVVAADGVTIKVEPNTVIRGTVFDTDVSAVHAAVEARFAMSVRARHLGLADLFGGKLCAALDRQHPRDLFDVHLLLERVGLTDDIRKAFLVYLISHPRPLAEVLSPNLHPLEELYEREFRGMTIQEYSLKTLLEVQRNLAPLVLTSLSDAQKEFLLSFKMGEPRWDLLGIPHAKALPGVLWKMRNIQALSENRKKHAASVRKLESLLAGGSQLQDR